MTKKTFKIRTPIWKTKSVGLAEYKLADMNYVEILYTTKSGERLFPDKYKISKEKVLKYPTQFVGVDLKIIPIKDLKIVKRKRK